MNQARTIVLLLGALAPSALAQVFTPPSAVVPHGHDTGFAAAPGSGSQRVVVHQFTVTQAGADWLRLYFGDVVLAGDLLAGNGAQLRLTSHRDAAEQLLDARSLEQWGRSSAYFNGDAVEVEVLAFPGTGTSRVQLRALELGLSMPHFSQCGPTDDRILSSDPRSGRLLPVGCTGWLIADCAGCFLTAGHCGNTQTVQFNVPLSTSTGALVHPPPSDQYAVDQASIHTNGGQGVGNDWKYFGTFPNSTTGLTAREAQGVGFTLANPPPVNGTNQIRITGFGTDSTPSTHNQVQQTHVGPLVTSNTTTVQYQADTTGGNSGSPVIWEQTGSAVGIHTHGGCQTSGSGQNSGTSYTRPELLAALANPLGVCAGGISDVAAPALLAPALTTPVSMSVAGAVVSGSATLHWRASASGLFQSVPMAAAGAGLYAASLPAFNCADAPEFYFSVQSTTCGQITAPAAGPGAPFRAAVGVAEIAFQDNFQQDLGWTTAATATAGFWQRGVPVNDPAWAYDPATDGDGSGACFLTENGLGNTDVDNGSVTLTSPRLDRSGAGDLAYWYYLELTNSNGVDALTVEASADDGATWRQVRRHTVSSGGWLRVTVPGTELTALAVPPSATTRVRFIANDDSPQSIVEAGVDGVEIGAIVCDPTAVGANYCSANPNSTGAAATIRANGSALASANDLTLTAELLPLQSVGYFVVSPAQGFVANAGGSSGNLCLGLPVGRYAGNILSSGAQGAFALQLDLTAIPQPAGNVAAQAGQTWNFQAWYRDAFLGVPTSNFTNGVTLTLQ